MQTVVYYYARRKPKAVIFSYASEPAQTLILSSSHFYGDSGCVRVNYFSKLFLTFLGVTQFRYTSYKSPPEALFTVGFRNPPYISSVISAGYFGTKQDDVQVMI